MTITIELTQPLPGQAADGGDLTTVTIQAPNTGTLRRTASIANPELRELAILEQLTGLTPGQLDRLSIVDLEALQAAVRPLLPNSLATGIKLSQFSLASFIGDPKALTSLQQKSLAGGLPG